MVSECTITNLLRCPALVGLKGFIKLKRCTVRCINSDEAQSNSISMQAHNTTGRYCIHEGDVMELQRRVFTSLQAAEPELEDVPEWRS